MIKEVLSQLTSRQSQMAAQQEELERRCAESRSHTDDLIKSIRQLKQFSDHQCHIVEEEQLSDQQSYIAKPIALIQVPPPTTVDYEQPGLQDNIREAKKSNIMNSAQTDEAADTTAELTSVVKEAASSYVVQTVMASTAEPTSHAGGYVDSIDTSEPTSVANNAASRAQVTYTSTFTNNLI